MARGDFKQRVVFALEDQASAGVGKIQGAFSRLGNFITSRLAITLGDLAGLFRSVAGAAGAVVEAAQQQEDAVRRLDVSLSALGPRASEVSEALQAQAAELERTTRFSDEAIIANQALAVNLGASAAEVGKLTQAAVELSSATGSSLESSFVNLTRTLNGFRGELGELVPEVATLSEEQLKAGAALDVILDRLGGSAQADVTTFSGLVAQLGNAWGTVQEKLGEAITENEAITASLSRLRDVITSRDFLDAVEFIADGFARISLNVAEATASIGRVTGRINALRTELSGLRQTIIDTLGPIGALVEFLSDRLPGALARLTPGFGSVSVALDAYSSLSREAGQATEEIVEQAESASPKLSDYADAVRRAAGSVVERKDAEIEAAEATRAVGQVSIEVADELTRFEEAERRVRREVDATTSSLQRRAAAARSAGFGGGNSAGIVARDSRNQAAVDRAVAGGATPFLGGTRIKVAGGSRLVRAPGE